MITLYHSLGARSLRCLWALEELQIPHHLEMVAFPPRLKQPAYLKINPIGSLPYFVDGETRINESVAVLEYLAARHDPAGLLGVNTDHPEFGAWLNWLHYGEATLSTPLASIFRWAVALPKEQRQPAVIEDCKSLFASRLEAVERALEGGAFLCAGRFTMADISVGYALYLARFLRLESLFSERTRNYLEQLTARPAFTAAAARTSSTES